MNKPESTCCRKPLKIVKRDRDTLNLVCSKCKMPNNPHNDKSPTHLATGEEGKGAA